MSIPAASAATSSAPVTFWISADGQGSVDMTGATASDALSDLLGQCASEEDRAAILAGRFEVRTLRAAINALPADDALVTDPRSIDEFETLCQSWIDDVGAQQDGADTVAIARRALGGDVDALRIVVSWS